MKTTEDEHERSERCSSHRKVTELFRLLFAVFELTYIEADLIKSSPASLLWSGDDDELRLSIITSVNSDAQMGYLFSRFLLREWLRENIGRSD